MNHRIFAQNVAIELTDVGQSLALEAALALIFEVWGDVLCPMHREDLEELRRLVGGSLVGLSFRVTEGERLVLVLATRALLEVPRSCESSAAIVALLERLLAESPHARA